MRALRNHPFEMQCDFEGTGSSPRWSASHTAALACRVRAWNVLPYSAALYAAPECSGRKLPCPRCNTVDAYAMLQLVHAPDSQLEKSAPVLSNKRDRSNQFG